MSHEQPENDREMIEKSYHAEDAAYQSIYRDGVDAYAKTLPHLAQAFELNKKCVSCMDEGTPGGVHAAGSGMLMNDAELEEYFAAASPDEITSHEGCGAARLYAAAHGLDIERSDQYAQEWAKHEADKRGLTYRHIAAPNMKRPSEGHFARTCYYDTTGTFNWDAAEGLTAGFVVSRKYMTPEYSLREASVAMDIAFGDHGLGGKLLSREKPFLLVAIAEDTKRLAE
ncbi:MAG: hypothetical protein AAB490_02230, partial [Patescibacteria group bacterium]